MVPFYVQLFMDTNEAEKRITLAQLNYSVPDAKEKIKAIVEPVNHDINIGSQGCRPLFLVFRNGTHLHFDSVDLFFYTLLCCRSMYGSCGRIEYSNYPRIS